MTWLRSPALHFVLIGAVLFGVRALRTPTAPARQPVERAPIEISAERIRTMHADFTQRWGIPPAAEQMTALLTQAIEEELLYREARVLALDFEDRSVQRRLLEKMRALGERVGRSQAELIREARNLGLDNDPVIRRLLIEKMRLFLARGPESAPSDAELTEYLERHREQFMQPPTVSFTQVFLSASTRGDHVEQDARAALAQLRSPAAAASGVESDTFTLGLEIRGYSRNRLIARFGKPFAQEVFDLPVGTWSGPIASPYGLHVVRVEEKADASLSELAAVRRQVTEGVVAERAAQRVTEGIARLRGLYEVRVDGRDDLSAPGTAMAAHP
jgi:parvulin-like peptidyl-prolyl isomerase